MRARLAVPIAILCAGLTTSCQASGSRPAGLPPGPQIVNVEMTEYSFNYDPAIAAGRVLIRVRNTGTVVHSLRMLPLTDDIPPIDEQVRGERRLAVRPFAGFDSLQPGEHTTFAVDLGPDVRYALLCFRSDSKGVSHLLRGMTSEFRTTGVAVTAGPHDTSPPAKE